MIAAEIEALRGSRRIVRPADPAFGLNDNFIPQGRSFLERPAENFFSPSATIDIGMIEKIDADLLGTIQEITSLAFWVFRYFDLRFPTTAQTHTTQGQARYFQVGVRYFY